VHYIIPKSNFKHWQKYVLGTYIIKSELVGHKWLAFHAINIIISHKSATKDMLLRWYEKTLASIQINKDKATLIDDMVNYLEDCQAISCDSEVGPIKYYQATAIGEAANKFYFDPKSVFLWVKHAELVCVRDHGLSCAVIASGLNGEYVVDKKNIPSGALLAFSAKVQPRLHFVMGDANEKMAAVLYHATKLCGEQFAVREMLPMQVRIALSTCVKDLERVRGCLNFVAGKIESKELNLRLVTETIDKLIYGVPDEVLDLVKLNGIGRVYGTKLYQNGIKIAEDIIRLPEIVVKVMGKKRGQRVIDYVQENYDGVPF
jgi:helicase